MSRLPRVQNELLRLLKASGKTHAYQMKRVLQGQVPHASVYAALSALETKGYARAEWALPDEGSEGGGPPRKYFEITAEGRSALAAAEADQRKLKASARRVVKRSVQPR